MIAFIFIEIQKLTAEFLKFFIRGESLQAQANLF